MVLLSERVEKQWERNKMIYYKFHMPIEQTHIRSQSLNNDRHKSSLVLKYLVFALETNKNE